MVDPRELRAISAAAGGESGPRKELAAELRHLKESSALSFARLGSKTHTSKSSMERYLNGKLMPPRQIVAAISDTCGGDTDRLLKLWDRAAGFDDPGRAGPGGADPRRAGPGGAGPVRAGPAPTMTWRRPHVLTVAALAFVVVVGGALSIILWSRQSTAAPDSRGTAPPADSTACTYPYVCFFDHGLTGSFRDYTDDFQRLTDSRGADTMVNSRRDDVVWLHWTDGHVECTEPLATYHLTTVPAVDGVRIARDEHCGPATGSSWATPVTHR
ncbi:MAG: helix-turn-helix domain-containing protein [Pseudonocardiaceae bacterium]